MVPPTMPPPALTALPDEAALQRWVTHEARLIDEQRWDEWLALFADNGRYWVPLFGAAQAEGDAVNALADEDRLLLQLRIQRLKSPRKAHSQQPSSHCLHVLQAPRLDQRDDAAGRCELSTPCLYTESRAGQAVTLAATLRHRLVLHGGQLRIALKRVDLLDPGHALPMLQLFI